LFKLKLVSLSLPLSADRLVEGGNLNFSPGFDKLSLTTKQMRFEFKNRKQKTPNRKLPTTLSLTNSR